MRILDKDYITIEQLKENNSIVLHWYENPTSEELKFALSTARDFVKANQVPNWVANTAKLGAISEEDQQWVNQEWFPTLIKAGIKNMAIVVAENIFGQMSIEDIMGTLDAETGFESRYFNSLEDALWWIDKYNRTLQE